ncbi:Isocitrate dehydrogenase [NAD] regulatory subunit 1, mitochondrial [Linum perenne]
MSRRSVADLMRRLTAASSSPSRRSITYMPRPGDGKPRAVTLIPGDGIGPLVTNAVEQVMEAMHAPVYFEVCLKGGLVTPMGGGVSSLNVLLRKELDLYASLVNCRNMPGLPIRHEKVDIVVVRENTEGEYAGLEHEVVPGVVESLKVITKHCSERIAEYAFEYAYLNNRKKVTAVHKANIMKLADGLFLESCREVAQRYPAIAYNEIIVDNCCMQLVSKPEQFDVMVTPNLYGNLVANTAAGIAGGTGFMPGGN